MRDDAGQPKSILAINTDITKKKSLEAQLLHAQRMEGIGMVAGGVAHDFNNLLTVINGYSEMVIGRMKPDDPSRGMLQQVYKAGERAATLTRQLLAFSRKQILQVQVLDLNSLIADAEKMLSRLIGEDVQDRHRMRPDARPGQGGRGPDRADSAEPLRQRPRRHAPGRPHHGHDAERRTRRRLRARTSLCQTRPLRAAGRPRYRRGHGRGDQGPRCSSRSSRPRNWARGPAWAWRRSIGIVKQSGGSIEFDSELGRGTTFQIYLPRVEEAVPASKSPADEFKAPRGTETLLLVDDDAAVRSLIRLALQTFGYQVLDAADGAGGAAAQRGAPGADPPAGHRRGHARHERPRTGRPPDGPSSGH